MELPTIVTFDFDGTLTNKDTLIEFIKFSKGKKAFFRGFLIFSPLLIAYKLHLYPNWKIKQKIFSYFFKGMSYKKFCELGNSFTSVIEQIINKKTFNILKDYRDNKNKIYIISASIEEWIKPWCHKNGIKNILATRIETNNEGIITGKFLSKNCYGDEKINRLIKKEPDRNNYYLIAYGDSNGDKPLLDWADEGIWIKSKIKSSLQKNEKENTSL